MAGEKIPLASRILRVLHDLSASETGKAPRLTTLARLKQSGGQYDPNVVSAIANSIDFGQRSETSAETKALAVTLDELRVGSILTSDLLTGDGTLIARAETEVSHILLEKLYNFAQLSGIQEPIYVVNA